MLSAWALGGPAISLVLATILWRHSSQRWHTVIAIWTSLVWLGMAGLAWDPLLQGRMWAILLDVTNFIAATSAWDSVVWLREHPRMAPHRYYGWWSLFWAALLGIALAHNVAFAWLAIEFSTLSSGALIIEMGDPHALEAAWKYILIASVGLIVGLMGLVFVYASLRYQSLGWATLSYQNLHAQFPHMAPMIRTVATVFIVAGFGTKAGLVPFHTWLPDAHSEAPSPVSGLLSGVLLGLSLFTIVRFMEAVPTVGGVFLSGPHLLVIFGTLSVVIGALALLVQRDIKRLLAYSSIEQVGIMAVAAGLGTKAALSLAVWQFVLHAVIKSSLFYGAGHLSVLYHTQRLKKITGLVARHPAGAVLWAVGILALAGLPPLGLAYSEWLIFRQLWQHHAYLVTGLVAASLTVTFAALTYHLMRTLWRDMDALAPASAASEVL